MKKRINILSFGLLLIAQMLTTQVYAENWSFPAYGNCETPGDPDSNSYQNDIVGITADPSVGIYCPLIQEVTAAPLKSVVVRVRDPNPTNSTYVSCTLSSRNAAGTKVSTKGFVVAKKTTVNQTLNLPLPPRQYYNGYTYVQCQIPQGHSVMGFQVKQKN